MYRAQDPKWRYDNDKGERLLQKIKQCDGRYTVAVYMKQSSGTETYEAKLKELARMKTIDRMVNGDDHLEDLRDLASSEILILNSGRYSVAAASASYAKLVIDNGHFPGLYTFLPRYGTPTFSVDGALEAADLCSFV